MLWVNTAAAGSLNAASGFDRLRVTTALTNAGTTANGAGVTTGGMVAPWIVDRTNLTFLSYQGSTLGLQPLLITAPAGGQVSFSSRGTTTIAAGLTDGTATLYQSGATALAYNTSVHALRFDAGLSSVVATAVTGNLTRGSNVVTNSTTTDLRVGQPISGTGIMPNAVITEVIDGTNFRISYPAVRDGASVSLVPTFALTLASGGLIHAGGESTLSANIVVPNGGELILLRQGGGVLNLNSQIIAGGLTKTGTGDLRIGADNRGTLTGDIVLSGYNWVRPNHQYALGGSTTNPYGLGNRLILNGAQLHSDSQIYYQSEVVVNSDSNIGGNWSAYVRLTVNAYANNDFGTPVVIRTTGNNVLNFYSLDLQGPASFRGDQQTNSTTNILGPVTGPGAFQKWGQNLMQLGALSPAYAQPITVNEGALVSLVGLTGVGADRALGSGAVTVNPGAQLGLASPAAVGGSITLRSDGAALGLLSLQYVGQPPVVTWASTAPMAEGLLGIDVVGFSSALNLATASANGRLFLSGGVYSGQTFQPAAYTAATLGVGADATYRLGGYGMLSVNRGVLVGANSVQVGILSNTIQAQSIAPTNGGGWVFLNTANTFSGDLTLNQGAILEVANVNSLGTGRLVFNGGILRPNLSLGFNRVTQALSLANNVVMLGDAIFDTNGGAYADFTLSGSVSLSDAAYGAATGSARTFTQNNPYARVILSGVVQDGTGGGFNHNTVGYHFCARFIAKAPSL